MPTGFHFGRITTRHYVEQHPQARAKHFKPLLQLPDGDYTLEGFKAPIEAYRRFQLATHDEWGRMMVFTINGKPWPVPLTVVDNQAAQRVYLICPCCTQKRESLFMMRYGMICRSCGELHYASQSEGKADRQIRAIRKARRKIWGNTPGIEVNNLFEPSRYWPKPKGMHQATFDRERSKLAKLEGVYMVALNAYVGKITGAMG